MNNNSKKTVRSIARASLVLVSQLGPTRNQGRRTLLDGSILSGNHENIPGNRKRKLDIKIQAMSRFRLFATNVWYVQSSPGATCVLLYIVISRKLVVVVMYATYYYWNPYCNTNRSCVL